MVVAVEEIEAASAHMWFTPASDCDVELCFREFHCLLQKFFLRHTRSQHDAEDLAQEVYLRLLRMSDRNRIRNLKAFMFSTAINLLRDRSRRPYTRVMRDAISAEGMEFADDRGDPSRIVEMDQALAAVAKIIRSLSGGTRSAFLQHRLNGRSHADIAADMRVSTSMVEKHISAAMSALQGIRVDFGIE
jgi:RNA polymerase sigma factor (sigma-70 family)